MYSELSALLTVIVIDLVLAGDNAIVVGMAAAGLERDLRRKAIIIGIAAAALLRIVFALFTTQLLGIIGLTLAGGLLLLWVGWKLWREMHKTLRSSDVDDVLADAASCGNVTVSADGTTRAWRRPRPLGRPFHRSWLPTSRCRSTTCSPSPALRAIISWVLVVGLALSVALMGIAATLIARVLKRAPWISYLGLALIAWVALVMIWEGGWAIFHAADTAGVV